MGTTPTYSWPYPEPTDPVANGAQDIEDLALAVETTVSGLSFGKILQVVSTTKVDGFTTTSGTLTDITGLSVSVTPTSATSTIFVIANIHAGATSSAISSFQLLRDSTNIAVSTGATSNGTFVTNLNSSVGNYPTSIAFTTLDSPATTSATTYKIQTSTSAGTLRVNAHGPTGTNYGGTSSITVMEVSG